MPLGADHSIGHAAPLAAPVRSDKADCVPFAGLDCVGLATLGALNLAYLLRGPASGASRLGFVQCHRVTSGGYAKSAANG